MNPNTSVRLIACILPVMILTAGCHTDVSIVMRNETQSAIRVHGDIGPAGSNMSTVQEVEIVPGAARSIPRAGYGDLFVTTYDGCEFVFKDINVVEIDPKFRKEGNSMFIGPGYCVLDLIFLTNNCLYVVMPGKKYIDMTLPQPAGFPRKGNAATK